MIFLSYLGTFAVGVFFGITLIAIMSANSDN